MGFDGPSGQVGFCSSLIRSKLPVHSIPLPRQHSCCTKHTAATAEERTTIQESWKQLAHAGSQPTSAAQANNGELSTHKTIAPAHPTGDALIARLLAGDVGHPGPCTFLTGVTQSSTPCIPCAMPTVLPLAAVLEGLGGFSPTAAISQQDQRDAHARRAQGPDVQSMQLNMGPWSSLLQYLQ